MNHRKWLVPDAMHGCWFFWTVFCGISWPNSVKKLWPVQGNRRERIGSILTYLMNCSKPAKWPVLKTCISPVLEKQPTELFYKKSCSWNIWNIHSNTPMLQSLYNKVADPQDCCQTYLLHALLRFYFSLGKTVQSYVHGGIFRTRSNI